MRIKRDNASGALINIDEDGYKQALILKQQRMNQHDYELENEVLKNRINSLEAEFNELQAAVQLLLKKSKK